MPRNRRIKLKPTRGDNPHYRQHLTSFNSKLGRYSLQIREIYADGNCLFRAIADQIEGDQNRYASYRQLAVQQIEKKRHFYQEFLHQDIREYLKLAGKDGEWGGHLEIQAISEALGIPIFIHSLDSIVVVGQTRQPLRRRNRVASCLRLWILRIQNRMHSLTGRALRATDGLPAINIAYHTGPNIVEHYSSIRLKQDTGNTQALTVPRDIIDIMLFENGQKLGTDCISSSFGQS